MLVFYIFITTVIILIIKYCWSRRKLYRASWNLPGKLAFPLIGTSYVFWNTSDVVLILSRIARKFGTPFGFWLGSRFILYIAEPEYAESAINSPQSMDKGGVYKYVQAMIGGPGLFSSGGDLWKMHRRLLNPTVQNYKILNSFYPFMNKCLNILADRLEDKHDNGIFNIYNYIEACSFDMFVKNTFGVELNVQRNQNDNFLKAVNEATFVVGVQIFQPWYQIDALFRLTKYKEMRTRSTTNLRSFIKEVLRKRITELSDTNSCKAQEDLGEKRLRIFIDEIIKLSLEEKCFSEEEMISESLTMLMAGYETSAVTISNIIMMSALHPEYQERAYQEIRTIFSNNDTIVTAEDLSQLQFTDRLIKETMRLSPTVPFTTRKAKDDFYVENQNLPRHYSKGRVLIPTRNSNLTISVSQKLWTKKCLLHDDQVIKFLGKLYVPAETELVISLFDLQRNKKLWGEDADVFNPDHFLPENVESRHPYSFLPFSAGARNCIGKKYAQIVIRMFVVWLLRNYKFSTDLKLEDLRYEWMIVMKLKGGYPVKIQKR